MLLRFAALFAWLAALAFLALSPGGGLPTLGWDKLNHFAAFAVLAILLLLALAAARTVTTRLLVVAWVLCFAYGLLLEALQWLMRAGRMADINDLLANALGALAGCVLFCLAVRRSSQQP